MISKQYICIACKKKSEFSTHIIKALGKNEADSTTAMRIKKDVQYTYMRWNNSVALLPNGWGVDFPAFLSHKSAIDNDIIDMMRPTINKSY
jgi:hypothetical protein